MMLLKSHFYIKRRRFEVKTIAYKIFCEPEPRQRSELRKRIHFNDNEKRTLHVSFSAMFHSV